MRADIQGAASAAPASADSDLAAASISKVEAAAQTFATPISTFGQHASDRPIAKSGGKPSLAAGNCLGFQDRAEFAGLCQKADCRTPAPQTHSAPSSKADRTAGNDQPLSSNPTELDEQPDESTIVPQQAHRNLSGPHAGPPKRAVHGLNETSGAKEMRGTSRFRNSRLVSASESPSADEQDNGRPTTNGASHPAPLPMGVADGEDLIDDRTLRGDCVEPPPQGRVASLLEAYDFPHEKRSENFATLVGNFESSIVDHAADGDQFADYLASGAHGLFIGKFVGEKFGPITVLLEGTIGANVEVVPGHATSMQLPAQNLAKLILFPLDCATPLQRNVAPREAFAKALFWELENHDRCPPEARDSIRRHKTVRLIMQRLEEALPLAPATQNHTAALNHIGEGFVRDAVRAAYDQGYNDARTTLNLPRDAASGYRGKEQSEDISRDALARIHRTASLQTRELGP